MTFSLFCFLQRYTDEVLCHSPMRLSALTIGLCLSVFSLSACGIQATPPPPPQLNQFQEEEGELFVADTPQVFRCEDVSVPSWRDNCFAKLATLRSDAAACADLSGACSRAGCFLLFALELSNPDLCERIPYADSCATTQECYDRLAEQTHDLSLCDRIEGDGSLRCVNHVYGAMARDQEDLSICDNISGDSERAACRFRVVQAQYDVKGCEILQETARSRCYRFFAQEFDDADLCELVDDDSHRTQCFLEMNDVRGCGTADDPNWNYCLLSTAERSGNLALCEELADFRDAQKCYAGVAYFLKDESICEKIRVAYDRDRCIMVVAGKKEDSQLCEGLSDSLRNDCYLRFTWEGEEQLCGYISSRDMWLECINVAREWKARREICNLTSDPDAPDFDSDMAEICWEYFEQAYHVLDDLKKRSSDD